MSGKGGTLLQEVLNEGKARLGNGKPVAETMFQARTNPAGFLPPPVQDAMKTAGTMLQFTDAGDVQAYQDTSRAMFDGLAKGDYKNAAMNAPGVAASVASLMLPGLGIGGVTRAVNAFKGMPAVDWRTDLPAVPGGRSLNSSQFPDPHTPVKGEHAGFYSDKPDVASKFASMFDGGAVYPVGLKFDNPVVIDAAGKRAAWLQFEEQAKGRGSLEDFNRFKGAFDDPKVDGIIIENTADEGTIYIPRAPSQVRSRFQK